MTWTKLGDEFSDECANTGLSDAAYRTHVEAIAWLYRVERTDLCLPKHLLRRFVGSENWENAVRDLVALDWWRDRDGHCQVVHHQDVIRQSIAAQQAKRHRDKKAQQSKRARGARNDQVVSHGVSADVIPDTDRQTDKQAVTADEVQQPSRQRNVPSVPTCRVCSRRMTSPLSIAEGICAECSVKEAS